jgi:hypothetical protein
MSSIVTMSMAVKFARATGSRVNEAMSATDRSLQDAEFASRLRRALDGEVFGEALFNELAHLAGDGWEPSTLASLAMLEREMRGALEDLCRRHDVESPDARSAAARGVEAAATLSGATWASFVDGFGTATDGALRGYAKLRAVAPNAGDPILELLTAHEEALADFARLVVAGEESPLRSVAVVTERLRKLSR